MRVGYVLKRYPRFSETFIVNEILAHEASGLEVRIFSLRPPSDTHFQDVIGRVRAPVHYLPSDGIKAAEFWAALVDAGAADSDLWSTLREAAGEDAGDVYQALLLAREARAGGITHLHAHFATAAAAVARLASKFSGIPYTFTAHAKDIYHQAVSSDALRRKLTDAVATITVSEYNRDHLRATFGAAAARVERIYNGLDLREFPFRSPEVRPARIVAVGRLVAKKGFADLITAAALLAGRRKAVQYQIIGGGPLEAALRAQIERLGLRANVELVGPCPRSAVIAHLQRAAAVVAPCVIAQDGDRDGLPTVLLEAMALGTPCVATDITGIPEVLRNGSTGLLVSPHDPAALAGAVERLIDDGALRVQLAREARRLIEAEFDSTRTAARVRAVFAAAERFRSTSVQVAG